MRGFLTKATNVLEVNEKDNWFTAYSKGAAKGYVSGALIIGTIVGLSKIVVKCINRNDEVEVFEQEMGAE